ncbi:hypothetical protein CVT26_010004 [Gymnopilus dilepis]|uniref:Uncharacterized protein n=1 Tax=Gymnopilus dilepis TaxID=231916 RepID=A0A409WTG4_9AGAR|nr:hypothetical protein CVT26_010004 [Gymnopilus dilepis]
MPSDEELLARVCSVHSVKESKESSAGRAVKSAMFSKSEFDDTLPAFEAVQKSSSSDDWIKPPASLGDFFDVKKSPLGGITQDVVERLVHKLAKERDVHSVSVRQVPDSFFNEA